MIQSAFRFFAICQSVNRTETGIVSLQHVVDELEIEKPYEDLTPLVAVLSAAWAPTTSGKRLALELNRDDGHGVGWNGIHLTLPDWGTQDGGTFATCPFPFQMPTPYPGVCRFDLQDVDGAFGSPGAILASYRFRVVFA